MAKTKSKKPAAKAAKTKQPKAKPEAKTKAPVYDVQSMPFWRGVAESLLPDVRDEMQLGEVATALRIQTGLLAEHWETMNRIGDGAIVDVPWKWNIDRKSRPSVVKVGGTYSEKHPMRGQSDVPDPDQGDLPGMDSEPTPEPEGEAEGAEVSASAEPEEGEERPGVHSADERI